MGPEILAAPDPEELADACGDDPSWACEQILEWTHSTGFAEVADWVIAYPLKIALILAVAWILNHLARRLIHRLTRRLASPVDPARLAASGRTPVVLARAAERRALDRTDRAETIANVLRGLASAVVWGIALVTILGELNVNLGPLLAGAGVVGVALGFGAQSMVRDFLAGFFMIVEDQFGVGDVIDAGEATGTVEAVTLRATRLRDVEGVVWYIPNGEIQRVGNKSEEWSRALLDVSVAYDTDLREAERVIERVARELAEDEKWGSLILEEPDVWGIEDLAADGITIRVVIKTKPAEQWAVMRQMRIRLKEAFDEARIEIPFPQRTMWLRNEGGTAVPSPEE